jgi:sulfoxide reductase heme-binding subunit YedZ
MKKPQRTPIFILIGIAAVGLVAGMMALNGYDPFLYSLIRACGLLGYLAVFLSCLSSAFLRQMTRAFGRPFVQVHHVFAVSGLVLLIPHALGVAWNEGSIAVFAPRFDSLRIFLALGGRPALWLLALGSLAALLRSSLRGSWRLIHRLNYVAFLLATAHGLLLGSDLGHGIARVVVIAMAVGLTAAIGWKKALQARQKARRS